MPPLPRQRPLDWQARAQAFDRFVMDPDNKVWLRRADGSRYIASALGETGDGGLTTFGPVVLGKILRGDAVDDLLPSLAAYFHAGPGIFLDSAQSETCEYWYLANVNALADAIVRARFASDPLWRDRVRRSADRLIALAQQIRYDFNDQGYRFNTGDPFTNKDIYRQPDAIGGYAYIMLFAHELLGDEKYRAEAAKGLKLYQGFATNPWYEIPSGALACLAGARLSLTDNEIDVERILDFALAIDGRPMQTGSWGGLEVDGLMAGFRTEPEGEAYSMESLMTLPYLLPVVRYRPEFAARIGRYVLNVAANMRLFYSDCLPRENQSRPDLTAAIPYERLTRSLGGQSPYASGDYGSHRSIYGGAYALIWGELVRPAGDDYLLRMDISRTDFLCDGAHPTFLYVNPYDAPKAVSVHAEAASDLYDLQSHRFLAEHRIGTVEIVLPPHAARVIAVIPAGAARQVRHGTLSCGGKAVDFHHGETDV